MPKETAADIACRLAHSHDLNDVAEGFILIGVTAGMRAAQDLADECDGKGSCLGCEDCTNHLQGQSYAVGKVAAYEELPFELRKKAGDAYAKGKDQEAKFLRDLAGEYEGRAKQLRRDYDTEYPK